MTDAGRRYAPSRRAFLALTGLVAGAGAGAAAFAAFAGHRRVQAGSPAGGTAGGARNGAGGASPVAASPAGTPAPRPPGPADWAALRRGLPAGRLVMPDSTSYATARLLFDPKFDDSRPAAIAYCTTPGDVSTCLAFVRKFGLPVAARAGGHSYGGWSTTSGLVIDVTPMAAVEVDDAAGTARVGAGTLLIDLYSELAGHGVTVPGLVPDGRRGRAGARRRRRRTWPLVRSHL